jgi:hypothetical protein
VASFLLQCERKTTCPSVFLSAGKITLPSVSGHMSCFIWYLWSVVSSVLMSLRRLTSAPNAKITDFKQISTVRIEPKSCRTLRYYANPSWGTSRPFTTAKFRLLMSALGCRGRTTLAPFITVPAGQIWPRRWPPHLICCWSWICGVEHWRHWSPLHCCRLKSAHPVESNLGSSFKKLTAMGTVCLSRLSAKISCCHLSVAIWTIWYWM